MSTRLKYEPSSELLLVTAKQLFSNRELCRSVQLSVEEFSIGKPSSGGSADKDTAKLPPARKVFIPAP